MIKFAKLPFIGLIALSTIAASPPPSLECDELYRLYGISGEAVAAETAFNYWGKLDAIREGFWECTRMAGYSGNPAEAVRFCEEDRDFSINEVESEYTTLHNEVLGTMLEYYAYLNYLASQQIYCPA